MAYENIGHWAFIIGVILAIVLGLFGTYVEAYKAYITALLVIIGLIVGFINIANKETFNFLIAAIALLATVPATKWVELTLVGGYIEGVLSSIGLFVAPAAVIVALKAIYDLAYKKK